ncbi:MAG: SDR family NAD(P)-dependent oxidoreductase [Methyloligellaceae bacterium]
MSYLDTLFALNGKKALITGGATGIGRMVAEALVQAGAHVMIASRKAEDCAKVAEELNAMDASGSAEGFGGDVSTEEGITALSNEVKSRTDTLHILFNNAGVTWGAPLEEFPHSAWSKVFDVNVAGLFTLTRDLIPLLEKGGTADDPARIINIGSVMGTMTMLGVYSYSASKSAVHHITRMLASELAPKHITVNAFAPGPFESKMTAFAMKDAERQKKIAESVPLGRIGRAEDLAGAALFLCGRGGSYISGAILPLDGGKTAESPIRALGEE